LKPITPAAAPNAAPTFATVLMEFVSPLSRVRKPKVALFPAPKHLLDESDVMIQAMLDYLTKKAEQSKRRR